MDELAQTEPHPDSCPACGSPRVAYLLYGLPSNMADLAPKIAAGKIRLAGCYVNEDVPQWHCGACHHRWGVTPFATLLSSLRLKDAATAQARHD